VRTERHLVKHGTFGVTKSDAGNIRDAAEMAG
jgi:hypothetical protein